MIIIGTVAGVFAIGLLCWLIFALAVYALPFFVAVSGGMWAFGTGAGPLGAIIIGGLLGCAVLAIGQIAFALVRPLWLRALIALLFVAPAVIAGFHATQAIARLTIPSAGWQFGLSIAGAFFVGITALVRLVPAVPPSRAAGGGDQALRITLAPKTDGKRSITPPLICGGSTALTSRRAAR